MSDCNIPKEFDLEDLKKTFARYDSDNSKTLNKTEFDSMLWQIGFTDKNLNDAIYYAHDTDNDDLISFDGE